MDNVVDLVAVARASAALARWWQDFLADPAAAGEHLGQLEEARHHLQALGPLPGRLGRAVAVVVGGGGPTAKESADAIALLSNVANWPGARAPETTRQLPPRVAPRRLRARTQASSPQQPSLPGM